ncbi:unnamed protein product [Schistosoma haematobium]|nr:unnamed protein product [Schistosoma haematobium]
MECFCHCYVWIPFFILLQGICEAYTLQKLLVISLDGFSHNYLDRAKLRNVNISSFERIWKTGIRVMKVHNEFITRTGPNHLSLVTGMHEESHGIVDNVFYDPELNDTFELSNTRHLSQLKWFDVGSEPIWVTNQRHGHKSAVTFWPGSSTPFKGQLPSFYYSQYNHQLPLVDRINQTIKWLNLDEVTLGLIYFHEPDSQGHLTGPDSVEIFNVIEKLNDDIGYLLSLIDTRPSLKSSLNIILTSDHGMSGVDANRIIILHDYINESMYYSPGSEDRVFWSLWPKDGSSSINLYKRLVGKHPKMNVFLKDNIPIRLHYSNNRRISPVVVYSEPGWTIVRSRKSVAKFTKRGDHGYDPDHDEMSPFFLATGPGFRSTIVGGGQIISSIHLIDIYPLMCALLNLNKPAPNNGSLSRVMSLLHDGSGVNVYFSSFLDMFTVGIVLLCCTTVSIVYIICTCISSKDYLFPDDNNNNNKLKHSIYQPNLFLLQRRLRNKSQHDKQKQQYCNIELNKMNTLKNKIKTKNKFYEMYLKDESIKQTTDRQRLLDYNIRDSNVPNSYNDGRHDDEEYEEYNRFSIQHIDDETFLNLLRQPNSKYP